jgi:hypothetical protein
VAGDPARRTARRRTPRPGRRTADVQHARAAAPHARRADRHRPAPHEQLLVEATDGPLTGKGVISLAAIDGGSETTYDLRLRVRSLLLKPVEAVLARAATGAGKDRLRRAGDDLAELAGGEALDHDV